MASAEAYLHAKFHLDPSNRLETVHQCYRQDRTDGQRSDSIGWTVLQTVAQKQKLKSKQKYFLQLINCVNLGLIKPVIAVPEISTERITTQRSTVDSNPLTYFNQVWRTTTTTSLIFQSRRLQKAFPEFNPFTVGQNF